MVLSCSVYGCHERAVKGCSYKFYVFPKVRKNSLNTKLRELKTRRRLAWYQALKRSDFTERQLNRRRICSKHFISGAPAADADEKNPDWIPSLHMGYTNSYWPGKVEGNLTKLKRSQDTEEICSASSSKQSSSNALKPTQDTAKTMTVEEVQIAAETVVVEEIPSTIDPEPTKGQNTEQHESQSNSKMSVSGSDYDSSDSFSTSAESDEDTSDSFTGSAMGGDGDLGGFTFSDSLFAIFILRAVKENDRNDLLRILKICKKHDFPRSEIINPSCWEAIRLATSDQSRKECLELLLEFDNGVLISMDDKIAFHIGYENDAEENIQILLQKGYEFHERPNGRSMLHIAASRGDSKTVSFLLNHFKNIDIKDSQKRTSLHYSAMSGHLEVSRILLESGADFNLADESGSLPLHYACYHGHFEVVRLLLERDLTTLNYQNFQGITPFVWALGDVPIDLSDIKYLLEKGARTNMVTSNGMTAFGYGALHKRRDCLPLLLESAPVSLIEKFCVHEISDQIASLKTETDIPEDIPSLTCSAMKIGTDCLTALINRNLPEAISQAPSLLHSSGSFSVYSPLAYLFGFVVLEDGKFDQCLDLLLKHKITMLDEFQRTSQLQWPRSRISFAHPFSNIIGYTVPLPKKLHYFNLLNTNGVTTDYCLQCYNDNSMPFATFTDYNPYYDPVMRAMDNRDLDAVKMLISASAILEPDVLNKCLVTNLPDTLDRASENFQKIRRMHEYLTDLKPVYYEYDQHVDPYFTASEGFSRVTLKQICRSAIRQQLREPTLQDNLLNFRRKILELPLPYVLKDYLLFKI